LPALFIGPTDAAVDTFIVISVFIVGDRCSLTLPCAEGTRSLQLHMVVNCTWYYLGTAKVLQKSGGAYIP